MGRVIFGGVVVGAGTVSTTVLVLSFIRTPEDALAALALLLAGPVWALGFCLLSSESDFAGAARPRSTWLRVLPWTFLLAPLALPNLVLIGMFMRDSRADNGRSWLTADRMRPGEAARDLHWPYPPER